ncbi:BA14K family protein [Bradyrhizobium sp. BWA-3-5]|uniref:BA14K family protein n=1 Tax=Bradyrhizobium sp. BWA-3-5 TaxID=3080013 RepID=UPI00293E051E|nr:BA14K family protein [Bradyrhizobium sp. BWA-3-5]WOH67492.1 BA14K family protein [Bradyrhizobium sp. BWA-3-5]
MKSWKIVTCALVLGTLSPISAAPAAAAPMMAAGAERLSGSGLVNVQYRRWHHRHHHYGWRHRHHHGAGAAVLGGLAAGAIIGGAIANSQARANDAVAYCAQRYRSYDPASGTYLGHDGNRHPCP